MVVLGLLLIKTIYFQIESNISISFLKCHLTLLLCATAQLFPATSSESFIFANGGGGRHCAISFQLPQYYSFSGREFTEARRER